MEEVAVNGPNLVCAGCNAPTTINKPVCDKCLRAAGIEPLAKCPWCERGYSRDKWGSHVNPTGGYVGKCELPVAVPTESR